MIGAPRQRVQIELAAKDITDAAQNLHRFGGHFDTDAVAGNDSYAHLNVAVETNYSILSIATAIPMPPLTHSVARPRFN